MPPRHSELQKERIEDPPILEEQRARGVGVSGVAVQGSHQKRLGAASVAPPCGLPEGDTKEVGGEGTPSPAVSAVSRAPGTTVRTGSSCALPLVSSTYYDSLVPSFPTANSLSDELPG